MKLFSVVILSVALAGCASATKNTKGNIVALAQTKAGANAENCGVIQDANNANQAFACTYNKKPVWFAINYGPIGWWAVAIPASGDPVLIGTPGYYWQHKRELTVQTCKKLQFNQFYDQQPIHCLQDDRK